MSTAERTESPRRRNLRQAAKDIGTLLIGVGVVNVVEARFGSLGMPADAVFGAGLVVVGGVTKTIAHVGEQPEVAPADTAV